MTEADRSWPQGVQEKRRQEDEVTKMGSVLWKECVGILSGHGELDRHFLEAVALKLSPAARDIKFSELLRYWYVGEEVPIDGGMSLEVQIASLGNSPPGEADHILIHVPTLLMGRTKTALMIGGNGRSDLRVLNDLRSLGIPTVDKMKEYSQAVNLLGAHLKNTS